MAKITPKVFVDANIIISAGKPPGGPEIARVVDLVEADLVTVLTTDLTITEVAKKHTVNDFDAIKEISQPHFRRIVENATGVALPDLKRPQLRQKLKTTYGHADPRSLRPPASDSLTNTRAHWLGSGLID